MRQRPIPFRPEMVRAILDGKKVQTRRLVLPSPGRQSKWLSPDLINKSPRLVICRSGEKVYGQGPLGAAMEHPKGGPLGWVLCPYGESGDRLWVRERWRIVGWHEGQPLWIEYAAGGHGEPCSDPWPEWPDEDKDIALRIQCDEDCKKAGLTLNADEEYSWPDGQPAPTRWRPAMFMPRALSRLSLEVTKVRVQRLQEITRADVLAEGVAPSCESRRCSCWLDNFRALWGQVNGKSAPWSSNPWVWAISFKRVA